MGYLNCSTPEDLYDTVYACSKTIKSLKGFQATNYTYLKLNPKNKSNRTITLDDILVVGLTTNPAIDFLFSEDFSNVEEVLKYLDLDNDTSRWPKGEKSLLIRAAKPGTFSGPAEKARSLSIGSVNTEDISRFYCLLRFIASKDRQGRKGKGIKEDTTIPFLDKVYPNMRVRLKKKNTVPVKALFKTSTGPPPPNKKELAMQKYSASVMKLSEQVLRTKKFSGVRRTAPDQHTMNVIEDITTELGKLAKKKTR
ncbi:hypothetical protein LTS12_021126 [Elasticomyces elasticus]|nr:hypothetical protein LTS12_021126 [Elasticomyces elasticus]